MRHTEDDRHWRSWMMGAVLITFLAFPIYAEEALLSLQQPFDLGNNTTLVIEDVDTQQSVVWLKIYSDNRTVDSAVIGIGGRHTYCGRNLTMQRIYSGGNNDLVALDIENRTGSFNMTSVNA